MIEIIVGDYKSQPNEILIHNFTPSMLIGCKSNQNQTLILNAEELGLKKDDFEMIIANAVVNVKILTLNTKNLKGIRKNDKKYKVIYDKDYFQPLDDFKLALAILTSKNRSYIQDYLRYNKVPLWFIIKVMTSNLTQLSSHNKKVIMKLDAYLFKINAEILYMIIANEIKPEPYIKYLQWNYPKKEDNAK